MGLWDQPVWIYISCCHCDLGHPVPFQCCGVFVLKMEVPLELSPRAAAVRMELNNTHLLGRILPHVWFVIHEHKLSL